MAGVQAVSAEDLGTDIMKDVESVFQSIYRDFAPVILAKCKRILGDDQDARDVAQEVAIKLYIHQKEFLEMEAKIGWIYRVTTHACLDLLRKRRRRGIFRWFAVEDIDIVDEKTEENMLHQLEIKNILQKLPEKHHAIFIYYYLDGMTQEETATAAGVSRITVARALLKIQQLAGRRGGHEKV